MMPFDYLFLSIATPLAVALILAFGLPKAWATKLACIGFAVPAFIAVNLWLKFSSVPQFHTYAFYNVYDTGLSSFGIRLALGLNGISLPLFVMAGLVGLAAGLYALQAKVERLNLYLILLLVMQGGLMGVFASVDVFYFYFFHELALIPTFIMVGIWGGRDRNYAAMKMTIYLTLGAMLSLIGLIAIYVKSGGVNGGAGSFDLIYLRRELLANPLPVFAQQNIFGLLMFGFGILVSLWPMHTWAPLGYGAAPTSAAMLHAGVLKKFGLYGLVQIALPLLPLGLGSWTWVLVSLALGNVLVIGLVTIAQRDLKQMIGYSSVMHMGYAFLGIAAFSLVGVGGVVLMMVAHGLSVALLFLLASNIFDRTQTFDMAQMGGLAQKAPVLAAFFVAATFASIGLPGFANFWGELAIFVSLWDLSPWVTAGAIAGVIISAIYGLRAAANVFFGQPTEEFAKVAAQKPVVDLTWNEKLPALVLLVVLLFVGFWPKSMTTSLNATLKAIYPAATSAVVATEANK